MSSSIFSSYSLKSPDFASSVSYTTKIHFPYSFKGSSFVGYATAIGKELL